MKKQAIDSEKISVSHISDIELIFRIYKELSKELNNKKRIQFFLNGQKI